MEPSKVVHPSHYNQGNIETIVMLKEITAPYPGFQGFLVGNIVKYISRANHKGTKLEDLKKAQFYLTNLISEVEEENNDKTTSKSTSRK